jgi:hypothetical protein
MTAIIQCCLLGAVLLSGCAVKTGFSIHHVRDWTTGKEWCEVRYADGDASIFPVEQEGDKWGCEHLR